MENGWFLEIFRYDSSFLLPFLFPSLSFSLSPFRRDEDWNWLLHMTQCVAYHRDDVIIEEGSKQRRLIQIGSGHVRIVKKVVVSSGFFF